MISCDFLVLGAGEAGIMMALKLAKNGSVFLVEENEVGGSWLYSLEFPFWCWQNAVKDVSKNEPLTTETQTKVAKINDKIQKSLDHKQEEILEKIKNNPKIKLIYGKAGFISKGLVEVNSPDGREIISFKQAVISTGKNHISIPEIPGIGEVDFLYQHNVFSIPSIPESLAIIGCTLFNLEVANLYANLGTKVRIIEARNVQEILRFFDSTCLNWTFRQLLKKNISFSFETKIVKITKHNDEIKLFDDQKKTYLTEKLYIFAKETFEGNKICLDKAGIKSDKNGIICNQNGQTIQRNIWAVGSCVQNYNKGNLHWVINNLAEKQDESKSKSIVLFGSNSNLFNHENKPFNFQINKIDLDLPAISLGVSYREAESRYGYSVGFEIFRDFFDNGFVKLTFNQVNGQILGIGLTGKLAQNFYSASVQALSKKNNYNDFKTFLLNCGLQLEKI